MDLIKLFEITVCLAYVTFWDKLSLQSPSLFKSKLSRSMICLSVFLFRGRKEQNAFSLLEGNGI